MPVRHINELNTCQENASFVPLRYTPESCIPLLTGMAENNASWKRPLHLRRDTLMAAASIYQAMYGEENPNHPGQISIPATFQIVYFIGKH